MLSEGVDKIKSDRVPDRRALAYKRTIEFIMAHKQSKSPGDSISVDDVEHVVLSGLRAFRVPDTRTDPSM